MVMENEIRLGDIMDKLTAGHGNIQSNRTDVGLGKDRQTAGTDTS